MILRAIYNLIILGAFGYFIWTLATDAWHRIRMPKHFECGSRWHVRRYAYYYDVPLYQCSKCEPAPNTLTELNVFIATPDDAELVRDHLLADEHELGHPIEIPDLWKHINYKPEVPS